MDEFKLVLLALAALIYVVILVLKFKECMISTMFLLMVTSQAGFIPKSFGGISGLSLENIAWVICLAFTFFGVRKNSTGRPYLTAAMKAYLFLFFLAFVRTALDLGSLRPLIDSDYTQTARFVLAYFLKPLQFLTTSYIVYLYCLAEGNARVVKFSIVLSSLVLVAIAVFYYAVGWVGSGGNELIVRKVVMEGVGFHANGLGSIGLIILAFFLAEDESSEWLKLIAICSSLFIIILSQSRAAMGAGAFIFLLCFRYLERKSKIFVSAVMVVAIISTSAIIVARINYGVNEGNTLDSISAGRIDGIWIPILDEIEDNLLLGNGLLSIWKGDVNKRRALPSHPHNAYLEILLDQGVLGLVVLFAALYSMFITSNRQVRYVILGWCIVGLSGNSFYPKLYNFFVFVMFGISQSTQPDVPVSES